MHNCLPELKQNLAQVSLQKDKTQSWYILFLYGDNNGYVQVLHLYQLKLV